MASFELLPAEITLSIFSYLDHTDIAAFSLCSKACRDRSLLVLFRALKFPTDVQILLPLLEKLEDPRHDSSRLFGGGFSDIRESVRHITLDSSGFSEVPDTISYFYTCSRFLRLFPRCANLKIRYKDLARSSLQSTVRRLDFCLFYGICLAISLAYPSTVQNLRALYLETVPWIPVDEDGDNGSSSGTASEPVAEGSSDPNQRIAPISKEQKIALDFSPKLDSISEWAVSVEVPSNPDSEAEFESPFERPVFENLKSLILSTSFAFNSVASHRIEFIKLFPAVEAISISYLQREAQHFLINEDTVIPLLHKMEGLKRITIYVYYGTFAQEMKRYKDTKFIEEWVKGGLKKLEQVLFVHTHREAEGIELFVFKYRDLIKTSPIVNPNGWVLSGKLATNGAEHSDTIAARPRRPHIVLGSFDSMRPYSGAAAVSMYSSILLASFQNATSRLYKLNTRVTHITLSTAPPDKKNKIEIYLEDCAAELIAGTFPNLEGLKINYATDEEEIISCVPNFSDRMFGEFFTSLSNAAGKPLKRLALEVTRPYPSRGDKRHVYHTVVGDLRALAIDQGGSRPIESFATINQTPGDHPNESKFLSCLEEASITAFTRDCRNGEFDPMSIFKLSAGTLTKLTINIHPWFLLDEDGDPDCPDVWVLRRRSEEPQLQDEPTVLSFPLVKELNANVDFFNFLTHHDADEFYDLGAVFPNVEDLTIFWADRREFRGQKMGIIARSSR
ncbi:hypothetical protein H072_9319 [Dactylellina haptotyla CBS 200.50]|uniref:F-box domain-containing protein n=1 Tax=Dactylellina haptotyla (strain CBS 200.50) TaxID=1284197 RepID=S8BCZ6_DACHA|nr:hypothetical protein H072_9319 [Dactylellina haptotyla CBS 200.50]